MLIAFCSIALAQSPATEQEETPAVQQESGAGTAQGAEPRESARLSLVDGIVDNAATHLGFAFSSYEMYTTNAVKGVPAHGLKATMLYPQIFSNFRGKRSNFHLDYSVGYRMYQGQRGRGLNTATHSGLMTWDLRLARSTDFQLTDWFSSSPNDYGFSLGQPGQSFLLSQVQIQPIYTQDILVNRQRLVRNSLTASVSQRVGKKTSVSLFGTYDYLQYGKASFKDIQGFQAGVRLQYQFKKWLFLDSSYSTYLNNAVYGALRSSTIHRLQVGGFRFQISPAIQLFTMGTVEYSHYLGAGHAVAGVVAGLARNSKSNSILLSYHHGLAALSPGTILEGDDVSLAFRHRLSSRFALLTDAAYMQGVGFDPGASLRIGSGTGGIQMGVLRNLVASMNVGYASQHLSNLSFSAPNVRYYTAYVGLQYFMPALRGR
jgi:hypothetical protein